MESAPGRGQAERARHCSATGFGSPARMTRRNHGDRIWRAPAARPRIERVHAIGGSADRFRLRRSRSLGRHIVRRALLGRLLVGLGLRLSGGLGCLASFALPALEVIIWFAWRGGCSGKSCFVKNARWALRCLDGPPMFRAWTHCRRVTKLRSVYPRIRRCPRIRPRPWLSRGCGRRGRGSPRVRRRA